MNLGLAALYQRMPSELRDLAGNPFMLVAIARTLAGTSGSDLPRNRGRLYEQFVAGWMRREGRAVASRLQLRTGQAAESWPIWPRFMTAAGRTALYPRRAPRRAGREHGSQRCTRDRRRGGMPADWTVDGFLAEVADDGLLRRRGDHLLFLTSRCRSTSPRCGSPATLSRCAARARRRQDSRPAACLDRRLVPVAADAHRAARRRHGHDRGAGRAASGARGGRARRGETGAARARAAVAARAGSPAFEAGQRGAVAGVRLPRRARRPGARGIRRPGGADLLGEFDDFRRARTLSAASTSCDGARCRRPAP